MKTVEVIDKVAYRRPATRTAPHAMGSGAPCPTPRTPWTLSRRARPASYLLQSVLEITVSLGGHESRAARARPILEVGAHRAAARE